ncbi:uncharacterized protein TRIADDRAFT_26025 [Trichoplax adhaerens]|uniref:Armadillo repeat-containing domain-containing protein n=1 Tax=Trichoplax adhaerens TaxID=10228 RepID=B3RWE8_TRIAD|nr:hypothetical protein TRIADDRAFT_26025 [Trichoplax adhaerens]EDV25124.1 hypothetical protein TRIADDRAFT_26025 [Trichoplax adhaerens]|eukprot:XP_002113014.1 hypothetical protein TRIADDRAFT_26025 [Trichoplax adhaerens]
MANRRVHSGPKERLQSDITIDTSKNDNLAVTNDLEPSSDKTASSNSKGVKTKTLTKSKENLKTTKKRITKDKKSTIQDENKKTKNSATEDEDAAYWERVIVPLLNRIDLTKLEGPTSTNQLYQSTCYLWDALFRKNLLGRSSGETGSSKRRSSVLHAAYRLLDQDDPKLLIKLARIIFSMKVSGKNLGNICKLVYLASRNESNDKMIIDENIPDYLFEIWKDVDPTINLEALTYSAASIKFLSGNANLQDYLFDRNCIEAVALAMNSLNSESDLKSSEISHAMIQLTGILANLADNGQHRKKLMSKEIVLSVLPVVTKFTSDHDLMLNIARIFSKLTQHSEFCHILIDEADLIVLFLKVMEKQVHKADLVLRLGYILGNIFLESEEISIFVTSNGNGIEYLLKVLRTYLDWDRKLASDEDTEEKPKSVAKIEDVILKIIRAIVNLSIYPDVGSIIATSYEFVDYLLQLLATKDILKSREIVTHAAVAISNLSFYDVNESALFKKEIELTKFLVLLLLDDNASIMIDVVRVFGNLTRSKAVRDLLVKKKVDEMMIALLDAGQRETVFYACGLLMNFMKDADNREKLLKEGGVKRLIDALRDFGRDDWQLAGLICKTLWNYSVGMENSYSAFGEEDTDRLIDFLEEYLDEDIIFDYADSDVSPETQEMLKDIWNDDFCPVATEFLQKVIKYRSDLEPLD